MGYRDIDAWHCDQVIAINSVIPVSMDALSVVTMLTNATDEKMSPNHRNSRLMYFDIVLGLVLFSPNKILHCDCIYCLFPKNPSIRCNVPRDPRRSRFYPAIRSVLSTESVIHRCGDHCPSRTLQLCISCVCFEP